MHCAKCGSPNPDNASLCSSCGASLANPYATPHATTPTTPINNYLIPAIFATACCCLPFGIVSIVYAAQVNGKLAGGDVAGAQQSAANAKMWFWIAFGLGLAVIAVSFILNIIGAVVAVQEQQAGGI